ncbi:Argininosuccinate lyase [Alkalidesulfovibrio alkalitolerans DSM 16529]|jgi:argininosuccinate lyase|uniref:Argininosuccinate lyase n=1 Tax=Alkalidesulfovibrio alkalitolerans DSM 16529 TaxID=1121439 RepID=S7TDP4_9BACT|nr:argininosuccinate lyase [Alkalidesulfovibrio alkalitolerans]EPR34781.1 Argininosuccinate lyase [Alkalidesulfovibrio alkalitolerans DSM 16529]
MSKLWGGRFAETTEALVEEYTESVSFDRALYAADIAGSRAHAAMLAAVGVLTADEARAIREGLDAVKAEIESGSFTFLTEREDVHMNIEARLTEIIGEAGKKLHTGRSRNDQVGLDFRIHTAARLTAWREGLRRLVAVLAQRAEEHRETLLPGCTHMQPAQPVSLAHHLLAYCAMFMRDAERIDDALDRILVSPLGAAALAGTTYPLDPGAVARELGFRGVFQNSMDAVSDRDFALEALFVGSLIMAHLSRLCEEIVIWANPAFGFVRLPDGYATGSSIMPQKKNPDVAELMRGKTGRVYGALMGLLTTVKGLPLAYNRDLQEDKEPFFDTDRTVSLSLACMAGMMERMGFVPEAMARALSRGFLNATELADYLVGKGLPFREAHHVTGRAVAHAEGRGVGLEDLSLEELRGFSPLIGEDVFTVLDYANAVARRVTPGSTGPASVAAQLAAVRAFCAAEQGTSSS